MEYIACICEGAAERAIIDLLLDKHKLIFEREDLVEEEVLRCRNGSEFEEKYLKKGFKGTIQVYRILDSRRENFKISKAFERKVEVINVITAPEIEMLIIFNEDKYKEFKKTKLKPSDFCKQHLKYKNVKKYDFVKEYFDDENVLLKALYEYKRVSKVKSEELTLSDLLRNESY